MTHDEWSYYGPATPRRNPQGSAVDVPCPYCNAPAGTLCRLRPYSNTSAVKTRGKHKQRKVAFKLYTKAVRALEEGQ
jgi:hypothetical protein